jgi:hypothetical protein
MWIRRNFLRVREDRFLLSLRLGMILLLREERLLRRNLISWMKMPIKSIMRRLFRSVSIVRGVLIKRLLLDMKRSVLRIDLWILFLEECNRKVDLIRNLRRFRFLGMEIRKRLLLKGVLNVEGFLMWRGLGNMRRFVLVKKSQKWKRKKLLRRMFRIRRIQNGKSNIRSLWIIWSIWSRLRNMRIKGFLLRIFLLLLSQRTQIIYFVSLVGESIVRWLLIDIRKCVLI